MLANLHTHTTFCDGHHTPREIAEEALFRGFSTLGFSGHGYTYFDDSYCIKDEDGYLADVLRVKEEYRGRLEIYRGVEEDSYSPVKREKFDYIIGSSHYIRDGEKFYPVDAGLERFMTCLDLFGGDPVRLAERYYSEFCAYIEKRRPDIIGHFDLITKYDEKLDSMFRKNPEYVACSVKYAKIAAKYGSIFEVNTGAISRGLRTSVYPTTEILHALRGEGARITLSSDSHDKSTLDFAFDEAKAVLREVGFKEFYTLCNGKFTKFEF